MQILNIYCNKNLVTASLFTAEPEPKLLLVARIVTDKKTGDMTAKVFDPENFRLQRCGLRAAHLERAKQPGVGYAGAAAWLADWLARMSFELAFTIVGRHVEGAGAFDAVTSRVKCNSYNGLQFMESSARWAWELLECNQRLAATASAAASVAPTPSVLIPNPMR